MRPFKSSTNRAEAAMLPAVALPAQQQLCRSDEDPAKVPAASKLSSLQAVARQLCWPGVYTGRRTAKQRCMFQVGQHQGLDCV